jgi:CubicO group peptidase (beta-lactamase class C family)
MKPVSFALALLTLTLPLAALPAQDPRLDSLDAFVKAQMARRHISGLSLAIIQDGKIAVARAYGVVDESTRAPVTTSTLFQAGSISKPVAALGALQLVEKGKLSLDENVNDKLISWKLPENSYTATEKVTLRRILSHSAGLTVHGFPGYDVAKPAASLLQVLEGGAPANTAPIRVDTTPGMIWRYSGGGFTLMQQLVIDVSGLPFPEFMRRTVLDPIGMRESSYEQPLPPARAALTATGYYSDRTPVRGRWHVYPEMAAAGLWTTASDLARFAIEIQQTLAGKGHGIVSPEMARQYLTVQKGSSGLGIAIQGTGRELAFQHGGRDEGFDANLVAFAETGQGAVLMINANDNSRFMGSVMGFIRRAYGWPGLAPAAPAVMPAVAIAPATLARYAGYYELAENQMIALVPNSAGTGLETLSDGLPDEELLAIDSVRFGSSIRPLRIRFEGNDMLFGPTERRVSRVAPLPSALNPAADPDAALTRRISSAFDALKQGGPALANAPGITPGAKKDLGRGGDRALEGLAELRYLGEENVSGRGIHRHGHDVARVRLYRVTTPAGPRYLFVHLTLDDAVTDYDVVAR